MLYSFLRIYYILQIFSEAYRFFEAGTISRKFQVEIFHMYLVEIFIEGTWYHVLKRVVPCPNTAFYEFSNVVPWYVVLISVLSLYHDTAF